MCIRDRNPIPSAIFETQISQMQVMIEELVSIESPSTDKQSIDQLGDKMIEIISPLNPEITIDYQQIAGNNIVASWPDEQGNTTGGIVVLCHMDTVHPIGAINDNPIRINKGKMHGPGIIDMKSSLVQVVFALQILQKHNRWPNTPITLLLTSDEEIGSNSSRPLIKHFGKTANLVLCMEPALSQGELKTSRKGVMRFTITTKGKSAHAGAAHEEGINAIEEMAHQIICLQNLTNYETGNTINIGEIKGGSRPNVIPEECQIAVDVRIRNIVEANKITNIIDNLKSNVPGSKILITGGIERDPMPKTPEISAAFKQASQIAKNLGIMLKEGSTGGGSDANIIANYKVPILDGLGPLGDGAHTSKEHLLLNSVSNRTALLSGIISEWKI